MFNRAILHLDLDAFFVSVERLKNAALQDKPLLIGGAGGRGVVACCSYEARRFGVHAAMPMKMACRLCPEAIVLRGDMEAYASYSQMVSEVVQAQVPLYEKASIDEFYADLTGMDRFFGCYQWSGELREKIIHETGLPVSFTLSVNKLVSKVGTNEYKPNGQTEIKPNTEKAFLAPLSVAKLPMIGEKTYQKLCLMGVRQVATLREIPLVLLEREFGKAGLALWKKAHAIDESPIVPYSAKKSLSAEQTFAEDTTDLTMLHARLIAMTEKLAFELRQAQKLTACVSVKIRYTDFNTYSRQARIAYTSQDEVLIGRVKELFDQLYHRRLLIRLVGVRFSHLVQGSYQIHLFEDTTRRMHLCQAMDKIRSRYGTHMIGRAAGLKS